MHFIFLLQHTEALLYGFQSIAETIDVNYSDVIPGLIGLIPRISINNVQLADTVMFTIGKMIKVMLNLVGIDSVVHKEQCFSSVFEPQVLWLNGWQTTQ